METYHRSKHTSEESLTSSSIIIMPQAASATSPQSVEHADAHNTQNTSAEMTSPVTAPSKPASESGSDTSSVSLISVPSSEDDDEALWQDSRAHGSEAAEDPSRYVVLYDEQTSSDEE